MSGMGSIQASANMSSPCYTHPSNASCIGFRRSQAGAALQTAAAACLPCSIQVLSLLNLPHRLVGRPDEPLQCHAIHG